MSKRQSPCGLNFFQQNVGEKHRNLTNSWDTTKTTIMSEQNNKVSYSAQSSNKYFGILLNLKGGVIPFDSIKYRAPPDDVCCDKCIIDIELLCIIRLETVTLIIINWMLRHQTSPESPGHTTCTVLTMESATLTWENYYCSFDFDSPKF